jgi:hypothetical protein
MTYFGWGLVTYVTAKGGIKVTTMGGDDREWVPYHHVWEVEETEDGKISPA